jgi:hypothetical protein
MAGERTLKAGDALGFVQDDGWSPALALQRQRRGRRPAVRPAAPERMQWSSSRGDPPDDGIRSG